MSEEFDYEKQNEKDEASSSASNEEQGSSVEYGPRFYGEGEGKGHSAPKKNRFVAVIVAAAVAFTTLMGAGGVLLGRHLAGANQGAASEGGDGGSADGSQLKDSVVFYETDKTATISEKSVAAVAAKSADSVVEIMTAATSTRYPNRTVSGAGSGVIIGESKTQDYTYIITNNHVVEGYETIVVRTTSGKQYTATVVGTDWLTDIAVLRISAKGLPVATYVESDTPLALGQEVVVIGNPLGALGGSVSFGIISGLSRTITIEGIPMTLLQTDAAINPGNSGGGLFDMNGNLVGIVNAKSVGEDLDNIGFAVPIATAISASAEIIEKGYVSGRADLGFSFTTSTTTTGLTVYSYAYNDEVSTEIQSGYILYAIGETVIKSTDDYRSVLASLKVGDTVQATVYKPVSMGILTNYQDFTVTLTVHEYTAK